MDVTEQALAGRIRRKLQHEDKTLRKSRSQREIANVGQWIVERNNWLVDSASELEHLGRRLGVLGDHETVAAT